jgi:16S rRNA (cytidine1402-2'-O)-methyltransferase
MPATLYLIPNTLGAEAPIDSIPAEVLGIVNRLDFFAVEDLRTARRYLRRLNISKPIDSLTFFELNEHTTSIEAAKLIAPCLEGNDMGIISEAGVPCIADPGSLLVAEAHRKEIKVVPLTGPSSIIMALMASGLNGQNFAFNGYLPVKKEERIKTLRNMERRAYSEKQAQLFMETPYRNIHLLDDVIAYCQPESLLCIASEIGLDSEFILTQSIKSWKNKLPDIHKKPVMFILSAP